MCSTCEGFEIVDLKNPKRTSERTGMKQSFPTLALLTLLFLPVEKKSFAPRTIRLFEIIQPSESGITFSNMT